MPAGVTIKSVYNHVVRWRKSCKAKNNLYGRLNSNKSITFNFTSKADAKGKLNVELAMGTMSIMKQWLMKLALMYYNKDNEKL
jgi:hypothetical protein